MIHLQKCIFMKEILIIVITVIIIIIVITVRLCSLMDVNDQ